MRSQGDAGRAKQELDELTGLHEFRARLAQSKLLVLEGVEALKKQRLDDALALFQKSAEQTPELPTSYYYLGLTWERKNEPARANEAYEKAIELKPDYAQAHASFGLFLWKSGDQTRGLEEFQRAVMSDPDLAEAHYNLGVALAQLQRLPEAIRELTDAASLDPQNVDARVQLRVSPQPKQRYRCCNQCLSRFGEARSNLCRGTQQSRSRTAAGRGCP